VSAAKRVPVTLRRAEWVQVFAQADPRYPTGLRDKAAYYFMYYTGIRVGELCNLRLDQVDLDRCRFVVPKEGKTGERVLGLPSSTRFFTLLERWLEQRAEWGVESAYFFTTKSGGRMNETDIGHNLARRARKAGIEKRVHPHAMRHSYAAERSSEGVTAQVLMCELGHTDLKTTQRYLTTLGTVATESMQNRVVD
jgi:site-specific recombinase XerD